MALQEFHSFTLDDGRKVRAVYDEDYQTRGSYGYDTAEETKAAEDEEIRMLNSGAYVVLGIMVSEPCDRPEHCEGCARWVQTDSVWGCVVENDTAKVEDAIRRGDFI